MVVRVFCKLHQVTLPVLKIGNLGGIKLTKQVSLEYHIIEMYAYTIIG